MPYLTDYSYNQLLERVPIKDIDWIDRAFFTKNIFDNEYLYYFFNQLELKRLWKERLLLSKDKENIGAFQEVPTREDNFDFVLSIEGKVKFHKDSDCEALHKGFKNFFMPEPVVELKETDEDKYKMLVQKVRQWFKENGFTVRDYEEGKLTDRRLTSAFNAYFPEKYNIPEIVESQNEESQFRWFIEKKTKRAVAVERSFEYDQFIVDITDLIRKRSELCGSKTMYNLSRYDFLRKKTKEEILKRIEESIENEYLKEVQPVFLENYGIKRLVQFWNDHFKLKIQAMNLLSDYFKWTYNYNLDTFDEVFLEDYNLEKCKMCYELLPNDFN